MLESLAGVGDNPGEQIEQVFRGWKQPRARQSR